MLTQKTYIVPEKAEYEIPNHISSLKYHSDSGHKPLTLLLLEFEILIITRGEK